MAQYLFEEQYIKHTPGLKSTVRAGMQSFAGRHGKQQFLPIGRQQKPGWHEDEAVKIGISILLDIRADGFDFLRSSRTSSNRR